MLVFYLDCLFFFLILLRAQVGYLQFLSKKKINNPDRKQAPTNRTNNNTQKKSYIVVPYYSGLSESIKNIGKKFGV